jgi:predicted phage-related endonuclease
MELVKVENGQVVVAQEIVNQIVNFKKEMLKMELLENQLKEEIKEAMEKNGIVKWTSPNGELKVVYKKAYTKTTVDSTRLKEELPDIYEEYSKTSEVASSISISVE